MANTEARRGLINPKLVTGGAPHMETRAVSSAYTTAFYNGQLVDQASDGFVEHATVDASTSFLGVCGSYLPVPSTAASSQVNEVQVITDMKNTIWEIQLSQASATGQTIIGNNVPLKNITSVSALSKQSRMNAGTAVTAAQPWKVVGFSTDPKNESSSANPRIKVRAVDSPTYHAYNTNTGI